MSSIRPLRAPRQPRGSLRICGVDEAGRGPLAGPVVAAAVILDPARRIRGLADSKLLTSEERTALALEIREKALAVSVGSADHGEIDAINILQATMLAMRRALLGLILAPERIEVDGNRLPSLDGLPWVVMSAQAVIGGDATRAAISAASIIAKTERDALMNQMDARFPGFGFAVHKGYPTPQHVAALRRMGPSPIHRRSFGPVKSCLVVPEGLGVEAIDRR